MFNDFNVQESPNSVSGKSFGKIRTVKRRWSSWKDLESTEDWSCQCHAGHSRTAQLVWFTLWPQRTGHRHMQKCRTFANGHASEHSKSLTQWEDCMGCLCQALPKIPDRSRYIHSLALLRATSSSQGPQGPLKINGVIRHEEEKCLGVKEEIRWLYPFLMIPKST